MPGYLEMERRQRIWKQDVGAAMKRVRGLVRTMVTDEDIPRIARIFGVREDSFRQKLSKGRFTAYELVMIAELTGHEIKVKESAEKKDRGWRIF